jgi:hypothetical protein
MSMLNMLFFIFVLFLSLVHAIQRGCELHRPAEAVRKEEVLGHCEQERIVLREMERGDGLWRTRTRKKKKEFKKKKKAQ